MPAAPDTDPAAIDAFIARWESSGGAERANAQLFLTELCDLLGLPRPDPATPENARNLYTFERAVTRLNPDGTSTTAFIDLYRARCFVFETKQGVAETHTAPDPVVANLSPEWAKSSSPGSRSHPGFPAKKDSCPVGAASQTVHKSAPPDPITTAPTPKKSGHGKRGTPAWDTALERAYNQGRRYIRELPPEEGRPPFLIVCDVGHV